MRDFLVLLGLIVLVVIVANFIGAILKFVIILAVIAAVLYALFRFGIIKPGRRL
jgi:hypothetical protein